MSMQATTGDVDEDINGAVIRNDFLKSFLHIGFPSHIQADERRLLALALEFGRDLFPAFFIYIQDHYSKVVPGQTLYYCLSNP